MPRSNPKSGALQLSPTQYKQLCKLCATICDHQEGGGYPPPAGVDGLFDDAFDIPIWVKPGSLNGQTGAGFWSSLKSLFDKAKSNPAARAAMQSLAKKGIARATGAIDKQVQKRGYGDNAMYQMGKTVAANKAQGVAQNMLGGGHQCGSGMYPAGY